MENVQVLMQALPYIRAHRGRTFLVKIGGALIEDEAALASLSKDVALLTNVGIHITIVHGGGPQATKLAERLGIQASFIEGRRVTDASTLEITKMVFAGKINLEVLGGLRRQGVRAVGLSGASGDLVHAKRRELTTMKDPETGADKVVDMGHVGDIVGVDTTLLRDLMESGHVPVVSSIAADADGNVLNINADTVATRLAVDLGADKFLLLTNVDGILRDASDPSTLISSISATGVEDLIAEGVVAAGMIPKCTNAVEAVRAGVPRVHMLNGHEPHRLLIELFTEAGAGTLITLEEESSPSQDG